MIDNPSMPWKVIGVKTGAIMGQFETEAEAKSYAKELMDSGSRAMKVEKR